MVKTLSLGIDVGTSKISVSRFDNQDKRWGPVTFGDKKTISTLIGVPPSGEEPKMEATESEIARTGYIPVYSVKRCVICEWSLITTRMIDENKCNNKVNYKNENWCQKGRLDFTVNNRVWSPSILFKQLMENVFQRIDTFMMEKYKDYKIREIKVGAPMIFRKGQFYIDQLRNTICDIARLYLSEWFIERNSIEIIDEPIAALVAYAFNRKYILPQGYFLVVDSGAGTTDIILCEMKGDKVYFINHDSIYIAGDDYDRAMETAIKNLDPDGDLLQKAKRLGVSMRELKEEYCKNKGVATLSLEGRPVLELDSSRVEPHFMKVTQQIIQEIEQRIDNWCRSNFVPQKVYITGGCFNVPSLRKGIENMSSKKGYDLVEIEINNPDLYADDHKVLAVSMGCALPKDVHIRIVVGQLPVKIVIVLKRIGENINSSRRFEDLQTLYDPDDPERGESSGGCTLRGVDPNDHLVIAVITKRNERWNLREIKMRRYYEPRRARIHFSMELKYEITYNCKLIIHARSTHKRDWDEIYNDYVKY